MERKFVNFNKVNYEYDLGIKAGCTLAQDKD